MGYVPLVRGHQDRRPVTPDDEPDRNRPPPSNRGRGPGPSTNQRAGAVPAAESARGLAVHGPAVRGGTTASPKDIPPLRCPSTTTRQGVVRSAGASIMNGVAAHEDQDQVSSGRAGKAFRIESAAGPDHLRLSRNQT